MRNYLIIFLFLAPVGITSAQENVKISTIDFVEVLNNNRSEALFYFQKNWKVLREMAVEKKWIDSYQLIEVEPSPEAPFSFILITTYKDQIQYADREKHFDELISTKGSLELLNSKKPAEFRKTLFSKETIH